MVRIGLRPIPELDRVHLTIIELDLTSSSRSDTLDRVPTRPKPITPRLKYNPMTKCGMKRERSEELSEETSEQ